MKYFNKIIIILIAFNIFLSSWYAIHKDLNFHTDIARDYLVLEEIVTTKKPTLIGPRSGGIPGVFHGPLWFYVNLPAFIIGNGNPAVVAWFWIVLSVAGIATTYYFGKKLFDEKTALLAALLLSVYSIFYTRSLFNPFGAVLFFPVFFYLFWQYIKNGKFVYLISALFTLGIIMQFQIAFGAPILFLTFIYHLTVIFKKKKFVHLLAYGILLIPLSTYILFDIRHDFLQMRSVIQYISNKQDVGQLPLMDVITSRIHGIFIDGLNMVRLASWYAIPVTMVFVYGLMKVIKNKKMEWRNKYALFFYYYIGFWTICFLYKGVVWEYYYWPFLPMTLLVFSSFYKLIDKRLFTAVFLYVFIINFYASFPSLKNAGQGWQFYHSLAERIYTDAPAEFGYYIYTPDQFGYSERYAMNFTQKEFSGKKAQPYSKNKITYLIIAPPPGDKPYLNGDWWKTNQIKIVRKPDDIFKYENGFVVEKYILTEEEKTVPSDPNLIQDLHFR
jgi:4-amino-4-deoxy-L-arabinose transferase-like glycosyltransferase